MSFTMMNPNGIVKSRYARLAARNTLICRCQQLTTSHSPHAKDPYDVLGVPRDAPRRQIKEAYIHLSKQYHPDVSKSPDAIRKFQELKEAHDTLMAPCLTEADSLKRRGRAEEGTGRAEDRGRQWGHDGGAGREEGVDAWLRQMRQAQARRHFARMRLEREAEEAFRRKNEENHGGGKRRRRGDAFFTDPDNPNYKEFEAFVSRTFFDGRSGGRKEGEGGALTKAPVTLVKNLVRLAAVSLAAFGLGLVIADMRTSDQCDRTVGASKK